MPEETNGKAAPPPAEDGATPRAADRRSEAVDGPRTGDDRPVRGRGRIDRKRRGRRSADDGPVRSRRDRTPPPTVDPDAELVVVQFKGHRKSYYNNFRELPLKVGQYCLVTADRGRDMGQIMYIGHGKPDWWSTAQKQTVLGVATAEDLQRLHENRGDEWEFWDICQEKIQARRLKMNLVTVERQFDHKKITFYFTADKRVDFRNLVRDLAAVFRTRIELRQIGVRDEARLKGGIGICGREFCCSSYLHEFVPVTLKMAKVQQLPLNPGKLSGPCGRLRCCMTYEHEVYREARGGLPRVGSQVETPDGPGKVRKLDLLMGLVSVQVEGGDTLTTWPVEKLRWSRTQNLPTPRGGGPRRAPLSDGCPGCPKDAH